MSISLTEHVAIAHINCTRTHTETHLCVCREFKRSILIEYDIPIIPIFPLLNQLTWKSVFQSEKFLDD